MHVATEDYNALKNDLMEIAYLVENEIKTDKKRQELLDSIIENCKKINSDINEEGFSSAVTGLEAILSSLYRDWPLTSELRNFCEGIRKLQREWGSYIPEETQTKIGKILTDAVIKALTSESFNTPLVDDFVDGISNIDDDKLDIKTKCSKANTKRSMEFFYYNAGYIPKGTIVYKLNNANNEWTEHALSDNHSFNTKYLKFGKNEFLIKDDTIALFEYKDEDGITHRITIQGMKALAEGQTEI